MRERGGVGQRGRPPQAVAPRSRHSGARARTASAVAGARQQATMRPGGSSSAGPKLHRRGYQLAAGGRAPRELFTHSLTTPNPKEPYKKPAPLYAYRTHRVQLTGLIQYLHMRVVHRESIIIAIITTASGGDSKRCECTGSGWEGLGLGAGQGRSVATRNVVGCPVGWLAGRRLVKRHGHAPAPPGQQQLVGHTPPHSHPDPAGRDLRLRGGVGGGRGGRAGG